MLLIFLKEKGKIFCERKKKSCSRGDFGARKINTPA